MNSPPYQIAAKVPTTMIEGNWVAPQMWPFEHGFKVTVELADAIDVAKRIDAATSGENAGLDRVGNYLFARFSRKKFAWGRGVSCLTQFTDDMGGYAPHNGSLAYEIWAVTSDMKHVIHLRATVTHPALRTWPNVKQTRSQAELYADTDYRLVSTCAETDFFPSLSDLDRLLNTLVIR